MSSPPPLTVRAAGVLLTSILLAAAPAPTAAQAPPPRAALGDTVWVILNHVKPHQRQNFERFTRDILWPALQTLAVTDSASRNRYLRTRLLAPTRQNTDSTYTYVYLMDPVVPGVTYGYRSILSTVYSESQVSQHLALVDSALARPQERYTVVQVGVRR